MADKITTTFGADTAELEGGMIRSVRYVDQLNKSIGNLGKAKGPEDLTASLARSNEQLAKGMNILRGGAVGAGVGALLGQMKSFASYAKELGDNATDAQKSAAKWGEEFSKVGDAIKGAGASVLGTLAGWGRSIGDSFRDPLDKEYDAVAESSEKMAERQEASLAKAKVAHAKAAEEIPSLLKKMQEAQDATANVGRDETAILHENQIALGKKMDATNQIRDLTVREAEQLKIGIEIEQNRAKLKALEAKHQEKRDGDQAARDQKNADAKAKAESAAQKQRESDAAKMAQIEEMRYEAIWKAASDEQRLSQAKKEGQEAYAKAQADASAENLLALEKARAKYNAVIDDMKGKKSGDTGNGGTTSDTLATGGRTRNEQGKLTRNGVVISEEDAARTDKTKAENKDLEKNFGREPEKYLEEIVKLLTPRGK
jgi:hypothetical protein